MTRLRQVRASELEAKRAEIEPAIQAVLAYSSGYTVEWALGQIRAGAILLLEVLQREEVAGYVLAQVDTHSELRVLYLFGVYGRTGKRLDYGRLREALEALARLKGCSHIRAKSPRKGWERVARAMGFEATATEFEKEVAA